MNFTNSVNLIIYKSPFLKRNATILFFEYLIRKQLIMKKIITLFILAVSLISCSSDQDDAFTNSGFVGKWNWTNTDGGFAFHIHDTPASTGENIQFELSANNSYTVTLNGKQIASGSYEIVKKKSIYQEDLVTFIVCSEGGFVRNIVMNGVIEVHENNTLNISDNFNDGVGSKFVRVE